MEEKKINKKIIFSICSVILIILVLIGVTYAYFTASSSSGLNTVTTGNLTMTFKEGELVRSNNSIPILDEDVETEASELPFSVTNTGGQDMNLIISLTDITISNELKDEDFRWALYNANTGKGIAFGTFEDVTGTTKIIYRDTILEATNPDTRKNYVLRIWIHEDNTNQNYMQGKSFSAKLTVDGEAVEYTPEECFTFDSRTGKITDYDASCGTDVVIPKKINGTTVERISGNAIDGDEEDPENVCEEFVGGFNNKGLTSIIIPNTVMFIEGSSPECYMPSGYGNSYGAPVFAGNNLTYLTIPETTNELGIEDNAFYDAGIETLFLPETVGDIWNDAFLENKLTHVILPSTIDSDNDNFGNAKVTRFEIFHKSTGGDSYY